MIQDEFFNKFVNKQAHNSAVGYLRFFLKSSAQLAKHFDELRDIFEFTFRIKFGYCDCWTETNSFKFTITLDIYLELHIPCSHSSR